MSRSPGRRRTSRRRLGRSSRNDRWSSSSRDRPGSRTLASARSGRRRSGGSHSALLSSWPTPKATCRSPTTRATPPHAWASPSTRPFGSCPADHPVTSPGAPLLEVEHLTFRYRRATEPAIRDLNLTVVSGEVVLVAGPSGCGKSTLIRAINGLIPHAYPGELTGFVKIDGRLTTELKLHDIALTVGTVLQDPAKQIVGATVEAELAFGPENLGVPRDDIRARIDRVVARAGIRELVGREPAALSGGERQ